MAIEDIGRIVGLLSSDAVEKQIAAAIVLAELKPKSPEAIIGLAGVLASGIPLLQCHALDALTRIGSKRALDEIFPLLSAPVEEVRRAAAHAVASVGESVVPTIKERMKEATPEERRSLDSVLAELGGKDAFTALIAGLASSDSDAAKAAALAVRQQVKAADGLKRRSYLAATLKFLENKKNEDSFGALAAAIKILGYLEDEKTIPTLLAYAKDAKAHPSVRQEAIIAFRFAMQGGKAPSKVVDALVDAAAAGDRSLAQTALYTLFSFEMTDDVLRRLEPLMSHGDLERARFVIEQLGRIATPTAIDILVRAFVKLDRRYAELTGGALAGKESAATQLAKALVTTGDRDRAWALRQVIRGMAKKIAAPVRKELLALALTRLAKGELGWEAPLDVVREACPEEAISALSDLAAKQRKNKNYEKAAVILRLVVKSEKGTDEDRFNLASIELTRGTNDTRREVRMSDEALRILSDLAHKGFDVVKALKKDKQLSLDELYYVAFHFAEEEESAGEELLEHIAETGARAKVSKMAKNKLALLRGETTAARQEAIARPTPQALRAVTVTKSTKGSRLPDVKEINLSAPTQKNPTTKAGKKAKASAKTAKHAVAKVTDKTKLKPKTKTKLVAKKGRR